MRRFRWLLLLSLFVVILMIFGCGTQANQSSDKGTSQSQSNADTKSATSEKAQSNDNDNTQTKSDEQSSSQTQSKSEAQSTTKDVSQAQSKTDTQSSVKTKASAQTQNKVSTPTPKHNPIVTITMSSGDLIKLELYPEIAPNTVKNFISLVQKGFYNGLMFHRVIPGFMIQGGDPSGNGSGGPGYSIKGEFTNNNFANNLKHERGVLSMARAQDPNSAGSQFFIMVASAPSLDGNYAAFGKVISGMEAVDKVVNSQRDKMDKPLQNQVMKSVTVDTSGVEYGAPEVIK